MGGDDEFLIASLFNKRDISLLGVSNFFFSITFEKSAFFGDHVCACKVRTRMNYKTNKGCLLSSGGRRW